MAGSTAKRFRAPLEPLAGGMGWVIARLPFDVQTTWRNMVRLRVKVKVGGEVFRTSLFADSHHGGHFLLVNKKMQSAAKARVGSRIKIWLEPDLVERPVSLPPELTRALNADRQLRRLFDSLSDSRRREFGKFADQPKSPAAREKRAGKIAEMLMQALEGERDGENAPPPILRALFQRRPGSRDAWFALTPAQRRNHLLGIFYYESAEARERRATKAIDDALRASKRKSKRKTG